MDVYPLDLVLATALAWATIFVGALPTQLLRDHFFTRLTAFCGIAWMVLAAITPAEIIHYYVLLGLLCFYAWWQLRRDNALSGKGWFIAAAGLGISLGVVLILAVTPATYPTGMSPGEQVTLITSIYLGGTIIGLSLALYFFTRRGSTRAGMPALSIQRQAAALFLLTLLRPAVLLFSSAFTSMGTPSEKQMTNMMGDTILLASLVPPILARISRSASNSPTPSRAGPWLLAIALLAAATEILYLRFIPPL